ncbi:unnamed protein product [Fraxinus pennsylvanica]|uniref:protein-serine/threonine phosphatase n=1 Tax=Fraxinus pennsylvanica TaxID=56036 RepID=A0AAD1ZZV8_9LAMI|nr:unnamed protein product [Fraxinus pennsylvanica]
MAAKGKGIEPAFPVDIINRLLTSRHLSTVRQVQMSENEIRTLCIASREIFLSQPNLLELEAPIKICGNIHVAALIGDKILCMHGGLSPDLHNFDQIKNMPRPTDVPDSGLLCNLLW